MDRRSLLKLLGGVVLTSRQAPARAREGLDDGYQSVPVNWGISSARKRGFFALVQEITRTER